MSDSRGRLGVFQRVVNGLTGMGSDLQHSPSVIEIAKSDGGFGTQISGVESGANLVERNPSPDEIDIGHIALLGDAGDGNQFPFRDGNAEGGFVGPLRWRDGSNGFNARGREHNAPAWWRRKRGRTGSGAGGDPAMVLQDQVFGSQIVFVGDYSSLQSELLRGFERVGSGNQIGCEPAGEDIARRTRDQKRRAE